VRRCARPRGARWRFSSGAALPEWSTRAVRDAFYSSPKFPRLLKAEAVKETISRGLDGGLFAYVGKSADGRYDPFVFRRSLAAEDIEITDDVFLITKEQAEAYLAARASGSPQPTSSTPVPPETPQIQRPPDVQAPSSTGFAGFSWSGEVPHQKWMNFYTKILSRFANSGGLQISVTIDVTHRLRECPRARSMRPGVLYASSDPLRT
jgi:hypothetical protein